MYLKVEIIMLYCAIEMTILTVAFVMSFVKDSKKVTRINKTLNLCANIFTLFFFLLAELVFRRGNRKTS